MHVCMYVVYVYMYVCMHVCMYVRTYVCMYVCVCMYDYVCMYACIACESPSLTGWSAEYMRKEAKSDASLVARRIYVSMLSLIHI